MDIEKYMNKLVTVKFIGALHGESHSEVITPLGTYGVDMVQYSAGSFEAAGYGCAPRWMVTDPGEHIPDSEFGTKRDAVAYIKLQVRDMVTTEHPFGDTPRFLAVAPPWKGSFAVLDRVTNEYVAEGFNSRYAARYKAEQLWSELITV